MLCVQPVQFPFMKCFYFNWCSRYELYWFEDLHNDVSLQRCSHCHHSSRIKQSTTVPATCCDDCQHSDRLFDWQLVRRQLDNCTYSNKYLEGFVTIHQRRWIYVPAQAEDPSIVIIYLLFPCKLFPLQTLHVTGHWLMTLQNVLHMSGRLMIAWSANSFHAQLQGVVINVMKPSGSPAEWFQASEFHARNVTHCFYSLDDPPDSCSLWDVFACMSLFSPPRELAQCKFCTLELWPSVSLHII